MSKAYITKKIKFIFWCVFSILYFIQNLFFLITKSDYVVLSEEFLNTSSIEADQNPFPLSRMTYITNENIGSHKKYYYECLSNIHNIGIKTYQFYLFFEGEKIGLFWYFLTFLSVLNKKPHQEFHLLL